MPSTPVAALIYNGDLELHKIQIKYKDRDRSEYIFEVHSSAIHFFECSSGCQIGVLKTGSTKTLSSDEMVTIDDDGKLKAR